MLAAIERPTMLRTVSRVTGAFVKDMLVCLWYRRVGVIGASLYAQELGGESSRCERGPAAFDVASLWQWGELQLSF